MASTNFGALTTNQLKVWSKDLWREARNRSFIMAFAGDSSNAMVQRITELKKTTNGDQAVITLSTKRSATAPSATTIATRAGW